MAWNERLGVFASRSLNDIGIKEKKTVTGSRSKHGNGTELEGRKNCRLCKGEDPKIGDQCLLL
ncbi:hypothetical protein DT065_00695 [Salicibibacter kimchii]|uniref:Uncharacterized protein n=1 Tax=Salicibibacter kimchii TaxID=2099786 RepID=A0A345BUP9_9BACI|nr:hypothetical protein DT065_00695 [Salicibibacter kimchii]